MLLEVNILLQELGLDPIGHGVSPLKNMLLHILLFNLLLNSLDYIFVGRLLLKCESEDPLEHVSEVPGDETEHLFRVLQL
jgi:hypothetical protein